MMVRLALYGVLLGVTALPGVAPAADIVVPPPAPAAVTPATIPGWTITLGVEGRVLPAYEGAENYVFRPYPLFSIRRAGTPARFRSPRDAPSIALLESGPFFLGPAGKLIFPRKESASTNLRGLGDVGFAFEAGVFAEYWLYDWLRTRVEVRQGFGGHHGVVADLSADVVVPIAPQWTLSGGPRLGLAGAAALRPYFGVDTVQSVASGLPVFNPRGGLRSAGLGAQVRYAWSPQWAGHLYVEYDRLLGDVADSPLVSLRGSANQVTFGVGAAYSFDVPGLW